MVNYDPKIYVDEIFSLFSFSIGIYLLQYKKLCSFLLISLRNQPKSLWLTPAAKIDEPHDKNHPRKVVLQIFGNKTFIYFERGRFNLSKNP